MDIGALGMTECLKVPANEFAAAEYSKTARAGYGPRSARLRPAARRRSTVEPLGLLG